MQKVEIDTDIVFSEGEPPLDLKARASAACNTIAELDIGKAVSEPKKLTNGDKDAAAAVAGAYADDPEAASKQISPQRMARMTPEAILAAGKILDEFSHSVVQSSVQIRLLVTNKLILESENPDPRVRMRALELLGKISDVGLFSEKSEVKVSHQSADKVRERLRNKITKIMGDETIQDAEIIEAKPIDVSKELGFAP